MHSHEDKVRMIELYLRYNRSATPVTNDPGYPNRRILRLWHKKFEVSKDDTFRYLTMGRPPTEVDCAARRKQRARPLRIASKPSHPPPIRAANPARANRRHPQAAPKPTPTTLAHATSISLASSPKPQLQTSKQSRACVHNIAWSSNHLPRHRNTPNSSTTCGFSFILQSLK